MIRKRRFIVGLMLFGVCDFGGGFDFS